MIELKATFEGSKEMKTKTNLTFSTTDKINEIEMAQMVGDEGHILFNGSPFKKQVKAVMKNRAYGTKTIDGKSHSQTIRALIFTGWSNGFEPFESGEDAYDSVMNEIEAVLMKKYDQ